MTAARTPARTAAGPRSRTTGPGGAAVQERSERTRRKLVHAGAEAFHRHGYAHATLGGIAASAGVTKGALYFHFASKDELAEAVQQRGCALLDESLRALRGSGLSPLQALVDATHWLAHALLDEPAVPASFRITKECAGTGVGVTDFHRVWLTAACGLLRQARDAGELREGCSWESAESLVAAAVCGIEVLAGTGMPGAELQRRVAALWTLLLPGLVPEGAAGGFRTGAPAATYAHGFPGSAG
ncbi:TetR/AcrR family transcriptional regulator (plasmid) [Streptomyces sp. NBC_01351]|uniref:ScbR family autoregulator-binding transcription factor n=1 Tax=Streptomyces sp. NBC_01351 TaxID=2903833 RepID=UPI002E325BC6|nr:ScbR family autoregulator-binding transcription factor [Streptomyces sp. NBC_01351]